MSQRSLLLLGGTGFVGRAIARDALIRGWRVVSLSRRPVENPIKDVIYLQGNALDPTVYDPIISRHDIDAIVHAIGVIAEDTPSLTSQDIRTFEAVNRDTATTAAQAAARSKGQVRDFGYISAAHLGWLTTRLLPRYQEAKYQAEHSLLRNSAFRTVIARPGFMYGSERKATIPFSWLYSFCRPFTFYRLPEVLHVDCVAHHLLEALNDGSTENTILEVHDLY